MIPFVRIVLMKKIVLFYTNSHHTAKRSLLHFVVLYELPADLLIYVTLRNILSGDFVSFDQLLLATLFTAQPLWQWRNKYFRITFPYISRATGQQKSFGEYCSYATTGF